jgi:hypothetical protein
VVVGLVIPAQLTVAVPPGSTIVGLALSVGPDPFVGVPVGVRLGVVVVAGFGGALGRAGSWQYVPTSLLKTAVPSTTIFT